MTSIVFDTEATDRTPGQICQLAYLIIPEDGEMIAKNRFFAVDSMSEGAKAVHGMSMEALDVLSGGQRFADRAAEIHADFARADRVVGHNVSADVRYLRIEFERAGISWSPAEAFCTMNHFTPILKLRRRYGRSPKPPRLSELTEALGIAPKQIAAQVQRLFHTDAALHDARYDVCATAMAAGLLPHEPQSEDDFP